MIKKTILTLALLTIGQNAHAETFTEKGAREQALLEQANGKMLECVLPKVVELGKGNSEPVDNVADVALEECAVPVAGVRAVLLYVIKHPRAYEVNAQYVGQARQSAMAELMKARATKTN